MSKTQTPSLSDPEKIRLLSSVLRQEIVDTILVSGPSSVSDLAQELARPADSLYYHIHKMEKGGILTRHSVRKTLRRDEILYEVAADRLPFRYDTSDPENREMVHKSVSSMLRVMTRDFERGLTFDNAVTEGSAQNIRGSRFKAWLSEKEIEDVNGHLSSIVDLLTHSKRARDRRLHAFAFVMTPLEEKPARRK